METRGIGVPFPARVGRSSILHRVQIGSEAHPASYPMVAGGKAAEREADNSPAPSAEVKNDGAIPPLPIRLHGVVLN
jgi:hypothetical protein